MVKLGKKKELSRNKSDSEGRRKNGAAPDRASEEENNAVSEEQAERGSNGDNASRASNSSGSDSKRATKRKAKSSERSGSNDSDDLPLNGSTTAAKKARKTAKPKAPAAAAKNGKKAASKRAENDAEDDEELADSNDEAGPSDAEEVEYEVEAIVGHKTVRGASYFLVRWKGYNKDFDTWELEDGLNCDDLIAQFRSKQPKADAGKAKGKAPKVVKKAGSGGRGRPPGGSGGGGAKKAAAASTPADREKEWVVERIIDFVQDDEGGLYRIRWKGFGAKDDTWEPESNLFCEGLIEKFKRDLVTQKNVDTKELRESPKKTKRLVNECYPRTNMHNRIERSSKRSAAKNRVFYGEE